MTDGQAKKCLASLLVRAMQIQTKKRSQFKIIRLAQMGNSVDTWRWENVDLHDLLQMAIFMQLL